MAYRLPHSAYRQNEFPRTSSLDGSTNRYVDESQALMFGGAHRRNAGIAFVNSDSGQQKLFDDERSCTIYFPAMDRIDGRTSDQLRPVTFELGIAPYAGGSVLVAMGNTRVICGVMIEENVPRWMKEQGVTGGWLTAEYSMLPYSTQPRKPRDIAKGRIDGRSVEIQRLIGRSLRAVVDLEKIGPRTIWVDCDVLQADGGTRTAAITGSYVAVALAVRRLLAEGKLKQNPLLHAVAAVSIGIVEGHPMLDLCYTEDVAAAVDLNLVMNAAGEFIELQGTGEEATFTESQLAALLALGKGGVRELLASQQAALGGSQ